VAQTIPPLAVMGVGSWPRPVWLLPYLHKFLENKISLEEFNKVADDAVKLCVQSQMQAGVTVLTDGEARRDNYASFVGSKLNGCQLIPLTDLLPLVDDPDKFKQEMQSLDVPAEKVRHPAVFGKLSRRTSLAGSELKYLGSITEAPLKVALPGPYLLTRLMWMDCITDKIYKTRDQLAQDVIAILREEIAELIQLGASIIQLDEPVLTEVVFTGAKSTPSFMCGALSERGSSEEELSFAGELINAVCDGFPKERLALHVCRGNWTPDEKMALAGDYTPLLPLFNQLKVGRLLLEFCTPRAGDLHVIKNLRSDLKLGLGVLNPKTSEIESVESIIERVNECIALIGVDRITINPDCGFATFADNPVNSADIATAKLAAAVHAAKHLRKQHNISG
jgi:5-methyltetrahydropteroyltriglutamate--homocysteine methyltransferase